MAIEIPKAIDLEKQVFSVKNVKDFTFIALQVYQFQFTNNPVYQAYCRSIYKTPDIVKSVEQIPFLPVSFFKTHKITTTSFKPMAEFKSSGTTGIEPAIHYVKDTALYEKSFTLAFEQFYGRIDDYCIIGLLPSYLERGQSSLVYMVEHLIRKSKDPASGFFLHDFDELFKLLSEKEKIGQKILLIGVTYALLDFASVFPIHLSNAFIMETGGMKGRQKEMIRIELYDLLKAAFGVDHIYSEYGMTELLSQAYSIDGFFKTPPWMRILLRDETDPFNIIQTSSGSSGAINVIDLANLYSCSFIATEDVGRLHFNGTFEVLGRMDNTDIRGCSLMVV